MEVERSFSLSLYVFCRSSTCDLRPYEQKKKSGSQLYFPWVSLFLTDNNHSVISGSFEPLRRQCRTFKRRRICRKLQLKSIFNSVSFISERVIHLMSFVCCHSDAVDCTPPPHHVHAPVHAPVHPHWSLHYLFENAPFWKATAAGAVGHSSQGSFMFHGFILDVRLLSKSYSWFILVLF